MEQVWLSTPDYNVTYSADDEIDFENVIVTYRKKGKVDEIFNGPPDDFIMWLFNNRCIMDRKEATEINEITLRSRTKFALDDFRNRVPLCSDCHRAFHQNGVTDEKQKVMRMNREIFLIALGRKEFI